MLSNKGNNVPAITTTIISDEAAFDELESDWRRLYALFPETVGAPLSWEWMRQWWRFFGKTYGSSPGGLRILRFSSNKQVVGILPLYLKALPNELRSLRFLSTGEESQESTYPEYLNLLHNPAFAHHCYQAVVDLLSNKSKSAWDEVYLGILLPGSLLSQIAREKLLAQQHWVRKTQHPCMRADLSHGFDAYLSSLPASTRQQFRRLIKQEKQPGIEFKVANESESEQFFEQLIALHNLRWQANGRLGAFSSMRFREFHKSLIRILLPKRRAFLSKLSWQDKPLAVIYGFIHNGKFDFYQSGIDIKSKALRSPGILAHLLSMRHFSEKQISVYDFLAGSDDYKQRLSNQSVEASEVAFIRPNFNTALNTIKEAYSRLSARMTAPSKASDTLIS